MEQTECIAQLGVIAIMSCLTGGASLWVITTRDSVMEDGQSNESPAYTTPTHTTVARLVVCRPVTLLTISV